MVAGGRRRRTSRRAWRTHSATVNRSCRAACWISRNSSSSNKTWSRLLMWRVYFTHLDESSRLLSRRGGDEQEGTEAEAAGEGELDEIESLSDGLAGGEREAAAGGCGEDEQDAPGRGGYGDDEV